MEIFNQNFIALTAVSVYWLVHRRRRQTSCIASSMQLHESYWSMASTTEYWLSSGAMLLIDATSSTESGSGCALECRSLSTVWLPDIWPSSANLSPTSMVTSIGDLLATAWRSSSQTVNIWMTCFLLCQTFILERSSCHFNNNTLSLSTLRHQLKHFYISLY